VEVIFTRKFSRGQIMYSETRHACAIKCTDYVRETLKIFVYDSALSCLNKSGAFCKFQFDCRTGDVVFTCFEKILG
jgi:hypothetical protein